MTGLDLASYFEASHAEAAARSVGLAREYFLALGFFGDAVRCDGGAMSGWDVREVDGGIVLDLDIPKRFRATTPPTSRLISEPVVVAGRLSSFAVEGRPLDQVVLPLCVGDHRGWVFGHIPGTSSVILAGSGVTMSAEKRTRGRRVDVRAACATLHGEISLVESPGVFRVSGGWMGAVEHRRDVRLDPSDVRSVSIEGLSSSRLVFGPGAVEGLPPASAAAEDDPLVLMVHRMLVAGDLDDAGRVEAVARALLAERHLEGPTDMPAAEAEIEAVVREAMHLLSLDDQT